MNYWSGLADDEVRQEKGIVDFVQEKMLRGLYKRLAWGKEKAYDEGVSVSGASANGHDPNVCGDHCVYSSTTNDALNDGLHERPW